MSSQATIVLHGTAAKCLEQLHMWRLALALTRLLCDFTLLYCEINIMATVATAASSSTRSGLLGTKISAVPYQPASFHFSEKVFGKTKVVEHASQSSELLRWKCLHYDEANMCIEHLLSALEPSFISRGFNNWLRYITDFWWLQWLCVCVCALAWVSVCMLCNQPFGQN